MSEQTATLKPTPTKDDLLKDVDALRQSIYTQKFRLSVAYEELTALSNLLCNDTPEAVNQGLRSLVRSVVSRYEKLVSKG